MSFSKITRTDNLMEFLGYLFFVSKIRCCRFFGFSNNAHVFIIRFLKMFLLNVLKSPSLDSLKIGCDIVYRLKYINLCTWTFFTVHHHQRFSAVLCIKKNSKAQNQLKTVYFFGIFDL